MTFMYDNVHICTYSMQLEAPGGYLCPRWYIIAFQMVVPDEAVVDLDDFRDGQRRFGLCTRHRLHLQPGAGGTGTCSETGEPCSADDDCSTFECSGGVRQCLTRTHNTS